MLNRPNFLSGKSLYTARPESYNIATQCNRHVTRAISLCSVKYCEASAVCFCCMSLLQDFWGESAKANSKFNSTSQRQPFAAYSAAERYTGWPKK